MPPSQTWLIVGASRGIGLEYTHQLLALSHRVYATARTLPSTHLSALAEKHPLLTVLQCDVADETSISALRKQIEEEKEKELVKIDVCVLNAGILEYPGRVSEISFAKFEHHMRTNAIGPLICASAIEKVVEVGTFVFISSDSGSAAKFRAFEDGFGVYSASKSALNQGLRHLAAELSRKHNKKSKPVILAIHPGEVSTDMAANVELAWEVEGIIEVEESVRKMLVVIEEKGKGGVDNKGGDEATFWDWEGRVYTW